MRTLISISEETIERHGLLTGEETVVIALSGGADSLALLHVLDVIRRRSMPELRLHAGHLHHGMRGAVADADAAFCQAEAQRLGIPCAIHRMNVPLLARERNIGEEQAGREARYDFLTSLAKETGATRIATAHHADDQAETVLMRCMRGAGPRGLAGIPYRRKLEGATEIIRPFLDVTRKQIEEFLESRGLAPRFDSTNLSMNYLRNRVRLRILPRMQREWPDVSSHLLRLTRVARTLHNAGLKLATKVVPESAVQVAQEQIVFSADAVPAAMIPDLLPVWLRRAGLRARMLTAGHYDAIAAVVRGEISGASLPGGLVVERSGGVIRIFGEHKDAPGFRVQLNIPGCTETPQGVILAEWVDVKDFDPSACEPSEAFMDGDRLDLTLEVRFPRPGDRMRPLGGGTKKLQDIFTDLRIPKWQRGRIPLVTMRDEPIWIIPLRTAEVVKVRPETRRVLRLRWVRQGT